MPNTEIPGYEDRIAEYYKTELANISQKLVHEILHGTLQECTKGFKYLRVDWVNEEYINSELWDWLSKKYLAAGWLLEREYDEWIAKDTMTGIRLFVAKPE